MTLANNYNPTKQLANGVTTSFTFNYDMINEDYAAVYQEVDGVQTLVDPDLYTVEFNNNGGNVIFKTAPAAGVYIVIGRSVPLDQETPYKTSSGFPANRVEENLDKLTAIMQQLADESDRSPKIPLGTAGVDLNLPAPSAGKALVWNDSANALVNSTDEFNNIVTDATAQANIATQKASEAAGSATAAANSASAALTSEGNAASSASAALTSQNAAATSAGLAQDWATKTDGTVDGEDYSAKYYALATANKVSFGNIGDIQYTCRTDVPNGGAWCDGAEYTQAQFPDVYQMLVDGKIQNSSYAEYQQQITNYGFCEKFGLKEQLFAWTSDLNITFYTKTESPQESDIAYDENGTLAGTVQEVGDGYIGVYDLVGVPDPVAEYYRDSSKDISASFKVPKIPDSIVIGLNDSTPVIGNGMTLGLTNGTINAGFQNLDSTSLITALAISSQYGETLPSPYTSSGERALGALGVTTDPEKSGLIADTSNLGKTVTLKAYVVLYASAAEASEVQAAEFMTALGGKANTDLGNVSSNIDYVVESYRNGTEWYRIYKSGWVEQGGTLDGNPPSNAGPGGTFTINFLKPFADTNYTVTGACSYIKNNENVNLNFSEFKVDSMKAYSNNGQFWRAEGQGASE